MSDTPDIRALAQAAMDAMDRLDAIDEAAPTRGEAYSAWKAAMREYGHVSSPRAIIALLNTQSAELQSARAELDRLRRPGVDVEAAIADYRRACFQGGYFTAEGGGSSDFAVKTEAALVATIASCIAAAVAERDGGVSSQRFMDELTAAQWCAAWFNDICKQAMPVSEAMVESHKQGQILYIDTKRIAVWFVICDPMNFSVAFRVDLRVAAEREARCKTEVAEAVRVERERLHDVLFAEAKQQKTPEARIAMAKAAMAAKRGRFLTAAEQIDNMANALEAEGMPDIAAAIRAREVPS